MRLSTARARLRVVIERASTDSTYRKQLQESPVELLVKDGLPYDVIEDFLREVGWQAEVAGYLLPECANTCALTGLAAYPESIISSE